MYNYYSRVKTNILTRLTQLPITVDTLYTVQVHTGTCNYKNVLHFITGISFRGGYRWSLSANHNALLPGVPVTAMKKKIKGLLMVLCQTTYQRPADSYVTYLILYTSNILIKKSLGEPCHALKKNSHHNLRALIG